MAADSLAQFVSECLKAIATIGEFSQFEKFPSGLIGFEDAVEIIDDQSAFTEVVFWIEFALKLLERECVVCQILDSEARDFL